MLLLNVGRVSSGSGAEFGQPGFDQLRCDGHHTGGGLPEGLRGGSVTGEQRCRLVGLRENVKGRV